MEMNTRLQVEHPVTEVITGHDLVEWQLRVAAGEPLPLAQDELAHRRPRHRGAALRRGPGARLPAVDRPAGAPAAARGAARTCASTPASRQGDAITPFYDPMIAKLIVHGADRAAALARLRQRARRHADRRRDDQRRLPARVGAPAPASPMPSSTPGCSTASTPSRCRRAAERPADAAAGGARRRWRSSLARPRAARRSGHRLDLALAPARRLAAEPAAARLVRLLDGKDLHIVTVEGKAERFTARLGDDELHARCGVAEDRVWVESDGRRAQLPGRDRRPHADLDPATADRRTLVLEDGRFAARGEEEDRGLAHRADAGQGDQAAGGPGDRVTKGQPLLVLEAMKMETRSRRPRDGMVTAVHCARATRSRRAPCCSTCRRGRGGMTAADLFASVPPEVTIVEVGPRDGLQNEAARCRSRRKVELIEAWPTPGLPAVEAGAFVSPKWVPQMAGSDRGAASASAASPGVRYPVLVPNLKGLEAALAAGADEVAVFGAASESFSQRNINCSIAESLDRFRPVIARARRSQGCACAATSPASLGCPYEGEIAPRRCAGSRASFTRWAATRSRSATRSASARPREAAAMLEAVHGGGAGRSPGGPFHDTYGQALANIYGAGARRARGRQLGGRPGRLPVSPRARRATSRPRTWSTCWTAWACAPASTWTA